VEAVVAPAGLADPHRLVVEQAAAVAAARPV
jgi:hypothetical protein